MTLLIDVGAFPRTEPKTGTKSSACPVSRVSLVQEVTLFRSEMTLSLDCSSSSGVTHLARCWDPSSDPSALALASSIDLHLSLCEN